MMSLFCECLKVAIQSPSASTMVVTVIIDSMKYSMNLLESRRFLIRSDVLHRLRHIPVCQGWGLYSSHHRYKSIAPAVVVRLQPFEIVVPSSSLISFLSKHARPLALTGGVSSAAPVLFLPPPAVLVSNHHCFIFFFTPGRDSPWNHNQYMETICNLVLLGIINCWGERTMSNH